MEGSSSFYYQPCRHLLQKALDAHDDATFIGEMFGDVFPIFIVVLSEHSFADKYDFDELLLLHSARWRL